MNAIGIDLGTTRTKTAMISSSGEPQLITNRHGEIFTPSVVYFNEDGTTLVGTEAVNAAFANPKQAVFNWKRHMGTDEVLYSENGKDYIAKDIATIILKSIKTDVEAKTGEPVNDAVISVPANYSNIQKQHTIDAGTEAGMNVICTPHEPTVGALGNHIHKQRNAKALTYDLGGGTFDVSIIQAKGNICEVISTGGIPKLGGRDINDRIKQNVIDEFESQHNYRPDSDEHAIFYQDLESRIEQFKISITSQVQSNIVISNNGDMLNMTITRDQVEEWIGDLVARTIEQTVKTLDEASLTWSDIDAIYPIGGGAMMPIVIRSLEEVSGKKVTQNCEAHCAAALGAAIAGRIEYDRQGKKVQIGPVTLPPINHYIREILSRSIGVLVLDEENREVCSEILGKSTPIPSLQMNTFNLTSSRQTDVRIEILQGQEGDLGDQCSALGHFELNDLPQRNDLQGRIEVTFDLDSNGLLTASARDAACGKTAQLQVEYAN